MLDEGEDHPPGDPIRRSLEASGSELLFNDELLHSPSRPPPRVGPVRHDVPGLDETGPLLVGAEPGGLRSERTHLVTDGFGLRGQIDVALTCHSGPGQCGHLGGCGVGFEQGPKGGGASQVDVGVVLPGEPDAAVHLNVEVGAQICSWCRHGGRHRGGEGGLVVGGAVGPRRVPHGSGGHLGGHQHVGAVVLDGLIGGDGSAELDPILGVRSSLLGALAGDPDGLGGQQNPCEVRQGATGSRKDGGVRPVEGDPG